MGGELELSAAVVFVQDLQRSVDSYSDVLELKALRRFSSAAP
jgi:catechol 2,3-dioxygenase-like lactoylglutathione lyase family enzyme